MSLKIYVQDQLQLDENGGGRWWWMETNFYDSWKVLKAVIQKSKR